MTGAQILGAEILGALCLFVVVEETVRHHYKEGIGKFGPREAALAEASHGAAFIVLPAVAFVRYGGNLPPWLLLAMPALMILGGFFLFNGAKFSVGWRDPKLIARASLKIGLAVPLFLATGARQFGNADPVFIALFFVAWWLLVTGLTKLVLLLRGLPRAPWDDKPPDNPHGKAEFSKPHDPGWKL
jgi:hypothetical protein